MSASPWATRRTILKEKADYVTDTVDHDGVVTALEHFGLI